jgi:hypothetical protein
MEPNFIIRNIWRAEYLLHYCKEASKPSTILHTLEFVTVFQFMHWCYLLRVQVQFLAFCADEGETSGLYPACIMRSQTSSTLSSLSIRRLQGLSLSATDPVSLNLSINTRIGFHGGTWGYGNFSTNFCLAFYVCSPPQRNTCSATHTQASRGNIIFATLDHFQEEPG